MDWSKFSDKFDESWHDKVRPFIESEECDKIYEFLKKESKRGKKIAPLSANTYRAFKETSLTNLKVILLGMCPYHTMTYTGEYVADGLLMGCSVTNRMQPSLEQFYGAIERELYDGLDLKHYKTPDVSYLASQGVLMLNAALTTEINKAGSHMALWEPFTKYFFEEMIATAGVPIIFLGKEAAKYEKYVAPFTWSFKLSHPASAAYKNTDWDSEGVFKKVNNILKQNNGYEISWLCEEAPF
jgi:uracil-DNA glycosylase